MHKQWTPQVILSHAACLGTMDTTGHSFSCSMGVLSGNNGHILSHAAWGCLSGNNGHHRSFFLMQHGGVVWEQWTPQVILSHAAWGCCLGTMDTTGHSFSCSMGVLSGNKANIIYTNYKKKKVYQRHVQLGVLQHPGSNSQQQHAEG